MSSTGLKKCLLRPDLNVLSSNFSVFLLILVPLPRRTRLTAKLPKVTGDDVVASICSFESSCGWVAGVASGRPRCRVWEPLHYPVLRLEHFGLIDHLLWTLHS